MQSKEYGVSCQVLPLQFQRLSISCYKVAQWLKYGKVKVTKILKTTQTLENTHNIEIQVHVKWSLMKVTKVYNDKRW